MISKRWTVRVKGKQHAVIARWEPERGFGEIWIDEKLASFWDSNFTYSPRQFLLDEEIAIIRWVESDDKICELYVAEAVILEEGSHAHLETTRSQGVWGKLRERYRDKSRDELCAHLRILEIDAQLAPRGRKEEKIGGEGSLGLIDIPEGPIRWVNVRKYGPGSTAGTNYG